MWRFEERPGDFIQFDISRLGTHTADTCGDITMDGLQIRYRRGCFHEVSG